MFLNFNEDFCNFQILVGFSKNKDELADRSSQAFAIY